MTYFLERIAALIHDEYLDHPERQCLVFPNRRAGLYFLKYLAARIEKPVFSPSILTINELFRSYSSLQTAGSEMLLFELYKVYLKVKKSPESFDDFYYWGDMLLNDFDDVDKYLVNASLLFKSINDIKDIDQQFGTLSDTQVEIIKKFWVNFDPGKPTREKSGFISIWSVLNDLYSGFRNSLKEQNLAYEGMIFRGLAENKDKNFCPGNRWDMVHFIGFNALNECEKTIMTRFKEAGKARFYWDYDNSYLSKSKLNSAGFFLRNNLVLFGNDMPSDWSYDTLVTSGAPEVRHRVIDTSSDIAQVKLIPKLLEEIPDLFPGNAHHTAVVLADENLLVPVLTSLPANIGDINITMGYPLRQTLIYTLIKDLMDLQRTAVSEDNTIRFGFKEADRVLKHSLVYGLLTVSDNQIITEITKNNLAWIPSASFDKSEYLRRIFIKPSTPSLLSDYLKDILSLIALNDETNHEESGNDVQKNIRNEFIYRVVLSINRLEAITGNSDVTFTTDTYARILDKMLKTQSVPFSGEPLSGVQIMGILETRALDFKNLIILSVNEGLLPSQSTSSSFIPFSLRDAFGLPSINHQESIYAYHFYRLLQRAENVTFAYNSNSEGLRSGEMSRFLMQMKYEKKLCPDFTDLSFEIKTHGSIKDRIERTEEHVNRLNSCFIDKSRNGISPSAINTWLNCRMKFYYHYVNGLKEPEKVSSEIDPAMFGNILHTIMKNLYNGYKGQVLASGILDSVIRNRQQLEKSIDEAIREKLNHGIDNTVSGNELIIRDVLKEYLLRILNFDKSVAPFTVWHLEDTFGFRLSMEPGGCQIEIPVGGTVDRIDEVNGVFRIVDYKTGTVADSIGSVDDLFAVDRKKDIDGWLQTLLYCEAFIQSVQDRLVRPSVYKVRKLAGDSSSDYLRIKTDNKNTFIVDDYRTIREEFMTGLKKTIKDIFFSGEPFLMTNDIRGKCSYCPYRCLCMR
ncbi:MAG TPA: PD-(D/E)XK nuclease family protein [Bacteroidales bacterium]|nr:PD-(D/E)XK nuclease family protein [Bacteroidales bacterium]